VRGKQTMADAFGEIVKWVKKFSSAKAGEEDVSERSLIPPPFFFFTLTSLPRNLESCSDNNSYLFL
jgi:hypothetical protein